jgi:flagellar biosynthesis/type III secretory pathway protein FliH
MSRLTLFRSPEFSLVANRALIKRDEVSAVDDTVGMLRRVARLREALDAECDALRARAAEEGRAQGLAEVRTEFAQAVAAATASADLSLAREQAAMQARVVHLAMAVVERIAGQLGPVAMVGAIAARALEELEPTATIRVRVAADLVDAVRQGLVSDHPRVQVLPGDGLGAFDCEIDTGGGLIEAGLPVQLAAVRAALAAASGRGDEGAARGD